MDAIEQKREEAKARFAARKVIMDEKAVVAAKADGLRRAGKLQTLLVEAGIPLVRVGGGSLHELREDVYDSANNTVRFNNYDACMMGGEPFAIWS